MNYAQTEFLAGKTNFDFPQARNMYKLYIPGTDFLHNFIAQESRSLISEYATIMVSDDQDR